ncbi:hypothetical protein ZWY2020_051662 [Hordeum vulgare]|nr:hypothetical protein ZWY2020_051662 [Hordeum vulgare]
MASQGAEGSAVSGAGNGNSQGATPASEATPTSQVDTPTSQPKSSRASCLLGEWNSTLFATFQSILEDEEEKMMNQLQ